MVWICLGWVLWLALFARLRHRRQQREDAPRRQLEEFLLAFREAVRRRSPRAHWVGLCSSRQAVVLEVDGQETPVSLGPLHRRYQAFPLAFDQTVEHLIRDIEEEGLDRPGEHDFALVADALLPQVRSQVWLESRGATFGDSALVWRSLGADLGVCYVIDQDWSFVFVTREHLRRWGRGEEDLFHLAQHNLVARSRAPGPASADGGQIVHEGDGLDAARLLLLAGDDADAVVAVPDRDCLWVGDESSLRQPGLREGLEARARHAQHPISSGFYRWRNGILEPLSGESGEA